MRKVLCILSIFLYSSCGVVDLNLSDSLRTNPSGYNQVLAKDEDIYVDFGFSPDHASAQAAFGVQDHTGRVEGTFSWEKSVMTFHPQQGFSVAQRYLLKYAGQVLDSSGKGRTYNIYIPFYYVNKPDSSLSVSMVPADGNEIQGQKKVVFTFSKGMNINTLLRSFSIVPEIDCTKVWNSSCTQLTVIPQTSWKDHTVYTFSFSQDLCSKEGIPLPQKVSYVLYSTSGAKNPAVQSACTVLNDGINFPVLLSGLDGIKGNDAIQIAFSEEMDREKTEDALSVFPRLKGRTYWPSDSTLLFIPDSDWEYDTKYTIIISTMAESRKGLPLIENYEIRFTPDISKLVLERINGKESDGFPIYSYVPEQEIEIDAGLKEDPENIYTFGFVLNKNLSTAAEKEALFSGINLKPLFPPGISNPKVVSQFWTGDNIVHITYTGLIPDGSIYSLTAVGERITVRTK